MAVDISVRVLSVSNALPGRTSNVTVCKGNYKMKNSAGSSEDSGEATLELYGNVTFSGIALDSMSLTLKVKSVCEKTYVLVDSIKKVLMFNEYTKKTDSIDVEKYKYVKDCCFERHYYLNIKREPCDGEKDKVFSFAGASVNQSVYMNIHRNFASIDSIFIMDFGMERSNTKEEEK